MIRSLVVKMKFEDFTLTSAERAAPTQGDGLSTNDVMDEEVFRELLAEAFARGGSKAVRLLGVGVRFAAPELDTQVQLGL